jgi:hypothetical protein
LSKEEQRHVRNEIQPDGFDEGEIQRFIDADTTQSHAIDLTGGGILVLFTQESATIATIAKEVNDLLVWLGTPRGFTVFLWWRDDPRILSAEEWPSKRSVNGGWTIPDTNSINVYRREEYDRVLIHEVIHGMGWDWKMPEKPLPCWGLGQGQTMPHLFEAWTELYAEWLWCGWHNVSWKSQRKWQDYQATQILARQKHTWQENTNVFAYYILKAALAPHIEFLWVFANGITEEERYTVLCRLTGPELARLRNTSVTAEAMSLRMSRPENSDL